MRVESMASDSEQFITYFRNNFNGCVRLLSTDSVSRTSFSYVFSRLDVLNHSLDNARGTLLPVAFADDLCASLQDLREKAESQRNRQTDDLNPGFVSVRHRTGRCGPPRFNISRQMIAQFAASNFDAPTMASALHVSEKTIRRRLSEYHLCKKDLKSSVSDAELDSTVKKLTDANRLMGPNMARARLDVTGIKVTRERVRKSMKRVDPGGAALRAVRMNVHHRRQYSVAGPNSLWHFDGNHKLIRWNIVIHGGIDGYSRMVTFLGASNNNRAQTVLELFMDGIIQYGVPSRVRCDHGGENVDICHFMETYRGPGRGSAIRGRSVHNQRIERLWVDVWRGCSHIFYATFQFLEQARLLDVDNPAQLWCLHYVFLPRLNHQLKMFAEQWNAHGLSTVQGNLSPRQLYLQRILALKGTRHAAVMDFFPQDDPEDVQDDYGADSVHEQEAEAEEDMPAPDTGAPVTAAAPQQNDQAAPELPHVVIPDTRCPFTETVLGALNADVHPLENVDDPAHGTTLFERTLTWLNV